jgi:hypothetical protein
MYFAVKLVIQQIYNKLSARRLLQLSRFIFIYLCKAVSQSRRDLCSGFRNSYSIIFPFIINEFAYLPGDAISRLSFNK